MMIAVFCSLFHPFTVRSSNDRKTHSMRLERLPVKMSEDPHQRVREMEGVPVIIVVDLEDQDKAEVDEGRSKA